MKLLFSLLITLPLLAKTQDYSPLNELPYNNETGELKLVAIEMIDGATKDQLFTKATTWFAKTYVDSRSVLEVSDRKAGVLLGNGIIVYNLQDYGSLLSDQKKMKHSLQVEIKDGRYRCTLIVSEVNSEGLTMYPDDLFDPDILYKKNGKMRETQGRYYDAVLHEMRLLYFGLKNSMSKNDNW